MKYIESFIRHFESKNNSWRQCDDCGKSPVEDYWFKDWVVHIPKSKLKKFICVSCLEKRVGRKLTKNDFNPYQYMYQGQEWFEKLD